MARSMALHYQRPKRKRSLSPTSTLHISPRVPVGIERNTASAVGGSNTLPSITSISPSAVLVDSFKSLNIRVAGNGFTRDSVINFQGVNVKTGFINSALLAITLLAPQTNTGT